jgi:subtilisin family serine protease
MRAQRNALLLIAAVALATALPPGGAQAQRTFNRGATFNSNANTGRLTVPTTPRGGGAYHGGRIGPGWYRGGLLDDRPGIVVVVPPAGRFIDDGPPPRPSRNARRRTNNTQSAADSQVPDEVIFELVNGATAAQIDAFRRRHRLAPIEQQTFQLAGTTLYRWRIPDRRSVTTVRRALLRDRLVVAVQGNHLFGLQDERKAAEAGGQAQYELAKLRLPQAHELAKGDDVRVAVIDSAIDASSPELAGSIVESFDALASPPTPHKHGTAIAGLIAAHGKLTGTAPDARILAVRAFNPHGASAQGTTFDILKGLDWAATHGARVINMSFAGPNDAAIHRGLAAAHKRGIVLVAAAGNAGPKSPPLYPAADANVIAVTATDAADRLLPQANRGRHIAIAAPGAQILVAVPAGDYEVASGTSYAAAEVSGIVALMLQRQPGLTPDRVRDILLETAKDLGPKGRDPLFGAGLADAYGAVTAEKPPLASAAPPPPAVRASTGAR